MIVEPTDVFPEAQFENAVTEACDAILAGAGLQHVFLRHFGLDMAYLISHPSGIRWRFIEAKAFNAQRGGIPLGNDKGLGRQLDLLLLPDAELALADESVRWVLADALQPPGAERYAIFTSTAAKSAVMGGVSRNKNNNLRLSDFTKTMLPWQDFVFELEKFLTT